MSWITCSKYDQFQYGLLCSVNIIFQNIQYQRSTTTHQLSFYVSPFVPIILYTLSSNLPNNWAVCRFHQSIPWLCNHIFLYCLLNSKRSFTAGFIVSRMGRTVEGIVWQSKEVCSRILFSRNSFLMEDLEWKIDLFIYFIRWGKNYLHLMLS